MTRFAPSRAALLVALLVAAGCSDGPKGSVAGKVTVGGKPLPTGQITFESQVGKRDVLSTRVLDGEYSTAPRELPVGPVKVSVVPAVESAGGPPPEAGGRDTRPATKKKGGVTFHEKYQTSEKSGLVFDLVRGPNTKSFDLDP